MSNKFTFAFTLLCITCFSGCGSFSKNVVTHATNDNSRLYWCINLIDIRKIERGMKVSELELLFGETLFMQQNRRRAVVPLVPWKMSNKEDVQWGAYWKITFELSPEGTVADYVISKIAEK